MKEISRQALTKIKMMKYKWREPKEGSHLSYFSQKITCEIIELKKERTDWHQRREISTKQREIAMWQETNKCSILKWQLNVRNRKTKK